MPFIFDDGAAIVQNVNLRKLWPLTTAAWSPGGPLEGRPVVALSFALNYALGGLKVGGYHAVNLAVHLGVSLLLLGWLRRVLAKVPTVGPLAPAAALAVALVWVAHPLNSEAVVYVTQRTELLVGFFYLLTLYAAARAAEGDGPARGDSPHPSPLPRGRGSKRSSREGAALDVGRASTRWEALAVVACALGMASKEVMVSAPLMVALADRAFFFPSFAEALRRRRRLYVGLAATWAVLGGLMVAAPHLKSVGTELGVTPVDYLANQCGVIVHYLRLCVLPTALSVDYGEARPIALSSALLPGAVLVGLVVVSAWAWRRAPAWGFAGAWFFGILAPSSSVVPIITEVAAERRMYLPSVAVFAVLVVGAIALTRRLAGSVRPAWLYGGAALATALGVVGTRARVEDYRTPMSIWRDAVRKGPDNDRAHNNLAQLLFDAGDVAAAQQELEAAVRLNPRYAVAWDNLCGVLLAGHHAIEARQACTRALELKPALTSAHEHLAAVLVELNDLPGAERELRVALSAEPERLSARIALGMLQLKAGSAAAAVDQLSQAVALAPSSSAAHNALGGALSVVAGRAPDARQHLEKALELEPSLPDAHLNLARLEAAGQRWAEALPHAQEAIALKPTDEDAQNTYVFILLGQERTADALAHLRALVRAQPASSAAHKNLGIVLARQADYPAALVELELADRLKPSAEVKALISRVREQLRPTSPP